MPERFQPGSLLHPDLWTSCVLNKTSRGPDVRIGGRVFLNPWGDIVLGARAIIDGGRRGIALTAEPGARLLIGEDVHIAAGVVLHASALIQIGRRCRIGKDVLMFDRKVQAGSPSSHLALPKPIVIMDDVMIGERVMIMPGVTIGWGSAIGAGALISKDVPPLTRIGKVLEPPPSALPWFAAPGRSSSIQTEEGTFKKTLSPTPHLSPLRLVD